MLAETMLKNNVLKKSVLGSGAQCWCSGQ